MLRAALLLPVVLALAVAAARADPPHARPEAATGRLCDLISQQAELNGLPPAFFARLIWKESRFDASAVSPAGAEGIAQFMPATARMRGLEDSFDPLQAIPASAAFLAELRRAWGNLGLAAAAYNAGEGRIGRWLNSGGFLPLETENYVLDILGEPADSFAQQGYEAKVPPLHPAKDFRTACVALPVSLAATIPMARVHVKPWGVQVAGNFRRDAAIRQYQRVKARVRPLLDGHEPVVSRVRSAIGRRGVYAVRIGADNRANADIVCQQIRGAGGSCVVMRNR